MTKQTKERKKTASSKKKEQQASPPKERLATDKQSIDSNKEEGQDININTLQQQSLAKDTELNTLKEQLEEEKNKALRAMAELENVKKRKQQEVDSMRKYAAEHVFKELLAPLDSFMLACEHAKEDKDNIAKTLDGFVLIKKQFQQALEKIHIKEFGSIGDDFDPNFHQAISQEKADHAKSQSLIKVLQRGYSLHDRVIRPALVVVAE